MSLWDIAAKITMPLYIARKHLRLSTMMGILSQSNAMLEQIPFTKPTPRPCYPPITPLTYSRRAQWRFMNFLEFS